MTDLAAPGAAGAETTAGAAPVAPSALDPAALDPTAVDPSVVGGVPDSIPDGALATLHTLLDLGGPVTIALAVLSVAGLAIAIAKLLQFRRARIWSAQDVAAAVELYRAGDGEAATRRLAGTAGPLARVVGVAMAASDRGDRTLAREETETAAQAEIEGLRGGLRAVEFIAGVSPLLGLFGTVLGMIAAFRALEAAGDRVDPSILAGGIWEALFTTAAGLAVAIPALALSNWLDRTVDRLAFKIELHAGRVLTAPRPAEAAPQGEAARFGRHAAE